MNRRKHRLRTFTLRELTYSETGSSRPAAAARAIPDLATLIFSAYCSGMRGDFHPPACVMAAKSMSSSARSCAAPTLVECPLTCSTNRDGIPIHCATRLKTRAMLPGFKDPPTRSIPINRRNSAPSLISACASHTFNHRTVSRERYANLPYPSASVLPRRISAWPLPFG
jgi:hypothetical protein